MNRVSGWDRPVVVKRRSLVVKHGQYKCQACHFYWDMKGGEIPLACEVYGGCPN